MRKFEYRLLERLKPVSNLTGGRHGDDTELNTLNDLGSRGWELCGTTGNGRNSGSYVFKRELIGA